MAIDGILLDGIRENLCLLAKNVEIFVITADTFGRIQEQMAHLPVKIIILEQADQDIQKQQFVEQLGKKGTVAIGNGLNDALMLSGSELGIGVIQREGAAFETLRSADIVMHNILDALDLFTHPGRLIATLRK